MTIFRAAAALLLVAPSHILADGECTPGATVGVEGFGTPDAELARLAELDGALRPAPRLVARAGRQDETLCATAPQWLRFATARVDGGELDPTIMVQPLPVRLVTVWSSSYPVGENDGSLWAGRGVSQLVSAGVEARLGPMSAALAPAVAWSENRAFDLVPNGAAGDLRFGNAFYRRGIDLPQRFGVGPFATWSPGQSYLRLDYANVALGVSTENLWLGPGIRNSILMSNAGPGFPHVFIGTSRAADIWIGKAEALVFWGRLERTRFVEGATHPMISGLALTYAPRWIPGLSVGLGRVMLQRWEDLGLREWLAVFQSPRKRDLESIFGPGGDNPNDNQLASLFARWVFPESGLELYGEWAREDHEWDLAGVLREPDHSQAYLLGLQKIFRAGARRVRVLAEVTHLQELRPLENRRGVPVYYIHSGDLGYTHQGQLLGAFIGPGADSQTLAIDVFHPGGRVGGYIERVRRNDAYYWAAVEPLGGRWLHDTELTLGARQVLAAGPVEVAWDAAAAWRQNRDFMGNEANLKLGVTLSMPLRR